MDVLVGVGAILLVVAFIAPVMLMVASVMYVLYKAWGPGSLLADYDNTDDPHADSGTPELRAAEVPPDDTVPTMATTKTKRKYTRKVQS